MIRSPDAAPATRERVAGALIQGAPLLGIGVWLWLLRAHESYYVLFFPGVVMLGTGLAVALFARFTARSAFVRSQASGSLRFHGIGAGIVIAMGILVLLSSLLDQQPFTLGRQPSHLEAGFAIAAFAFGAVLPVIETARAIACGIAAWNAA
jgi:hypothetical protein